MTSHSAMSTWTGCPVAINADEDSFEIDTAKNKTKLIPTRAALISPVLRNEMARQEIVVPDKPARVTKSTGSTYEVFGIHGISRDEANHLIVALDRVPTLRYIAIDLMRLVHPLLPEEDYSDE